MCRDKKYDFAIKKQVNDLFEHDLLCGKFEDLAKECLYLTYMGNELPDRAEEMYATIIDIGSTQAKLEDVLQIGNQELPEIEAFLLLLLLKKRKEEIKMIKVLFICHGNIMR